MSAEGVVWTPTATRTLPAEQAEKKPKRTIRPLSQVVLDARLKVAVPYD